MDNLFRDIQRLELIGEDYTGLEKFPLTVRLEDFVRYYLSRFLRNLKTVFSNFSHPEIADFHDRHRIKLTAVFKDPFFSLNGILVPIPHAMIMSYATTLEELLKLLEVVSFDTLNEDLVKFQTTFNTGDFSTNSTSMSFSTSQFEEGKKILGGLYGKMGLTHALAEDVLGTLSDTNTVLIQLETATLKYFPQVVVLNKTVGSLSELHSKIMIPVDQQELIKSALLSLAYRISLGAITLNHLQQLEHAFTKTLDVLLKKHKT